MWGRFVAWAYNEDTVEGRLPAMLASKHPHIRGLAEQYREGGKCPVHDCGSALAYSCPESGFLTHCSKRCYEADGAHSNYVEELTEIHEDLADLYSGRPFPEFQFPGPPRPGNIELVNWTTFFLDRRMKWNDDLRSARHISQMFTWPLSIAHALQKASGSSTITELRQSEAIVPEQDDALRIAIIGARQEATLPHRVWQELSFLCPGLAFQIHFVGPQVLPSLDGTSSKVSDHLELSFSTAKFEELPPSTPEPDVYVFFNSGVGYQNLAGEEDWTPTLTKALDSGKPLIFTSFSKEDAQRDQDFLLGLEADYEVLFSLEENAFMNMKKDAARNNYRYMIHSNHSIQMIRGL